MSLALSRRTRALVAATALAVSGVTVLAAPANAAADTRPVTIGADWLAAQLVNGLQQSPYGGPDVGLSIDTAMALKAVGGHSADLTAISDAVGPQLVKTGSGNYGYAESDEYTYDPNGPGVFIQKGYYASGLAKSLYFGENFGVANITTWSGTTLQADLEGLVTATGPSTGRLADNSSFGDYASTLSQAYAASALATAGSTKANDVLGFLMEQQCTAGFFRLNFTEDKAATDQTCDGGRAAGDSPADPDVTSEVLRLIVPLVGTDVGLARRIGKAEAWLLNQQHADGSFNGGTATNVPNANSTGLAGWVLNGLGDHDAATRAAVWIRQHQADELAGCANGLSSATGAIGYDDAGVANGVTSGLGTAAPTWVRASSQALPVLQVLQTVTPALAMTGPSYYLRAGGTGPFTATGVVPGDKVCLTGSGTPLRGVADAAGKVVLHPLLPAGTANRTLTVTDRAANTDTAVAKVLGVKTFGVTVSKASVKRGKTVTVNVTGLAPGELLSIGLRGTTIAYGTATAAGTYTTSIKVGRKLGKAPIGVYGQFRYLPREGHTSVKVTR